MSIFGSIMDKIFGSSEAAAEPAAASASSAPANATGGGAPAAGQSVDVEAVLTNLASSNSQQLNWRTSIVDLMKLLNLDSSLNARKELAQELHYSGDMNDSAAMNIWLHKQVMRNWPIMAARYPTI
jgi:hypothetical protein